MVHPRNGTTGDLNLLPSARQAVQVITIAEVERPPAVWTEDLAVRKRDARTIEVNPADSSEDQKIGCG